MILEQLRRPHRLPSGNGAAGSACPPQRLGRAGGRRVDRVV